MLRLLCIVVVIQQCAVARHVLVGQAPDAKKPAGIALRFAWPAGMTAHVKSSRTQLRTRSARTDTTYSEGAYRLRVTPHARGLLISIDSLRSPLASGDSVAEALALVQAAFPSFVVSREGDYVGLDDPARSVTAIRKLLGSIVDSAVRRNPGAQPVLDAMMSEPFLSQKAAEHWNALVGTWVGAAFEPGHTYENTSQETIPLPGLAGRTVTYNYEFSFSGRVPCLEEQPEPQCVELTMVSYPDPDSLLALLSTITSQLAGDAAAPTIIDTLDIEFTTTLITDTATLRPFYLSTTQEVSVSLHEKGKSELQSMVQTMTRTFDFAYAPRREPQPFTPSGKNIFSAVMGTWGWSRGKYTCEGNPHTISFSAARDTMRLTFRDMTESDSTDADRTSTYVIRAITPTSIRAFLIGEDRRSDSGELVVWDLVLLGPDAYRWHRSDWEPADYTRAVVRCPQR